MEQRKLNFINSTTNGFHDRVATINEEFVDDNPDNVKKEVDVLIKELKDFKTNIEKNGI